MMISIPSIIIPKLARPRWTGESALSKIGLVLAVVAAASAPARMSFAPAPEGDPMTVAAKMISDAGHDCLVVMTAERLEDGSIRASCTNGKIYRLTRVSGLGIALKCSVAVNVGIVGC